MGKGKRLFFLIEPKTACQINVLHFSTTSHTEFLNHSQTLTTSHKILSWCLAQSKFCTCTKHHGPHYPTKRAHNPPQTQNPDLSLWRNLLTSPLSRRSPAQLQNGHPWAGSSSPSPSLVLTYSSPRHQIITTPTRKGPIHSFILVETKVFANVNRLWLSLKEPNRFFIRSERKGEIWGHLQPRPLKSNSTLHKLTITMFFCIHKVSRLIQFNLNELPVLSGLDLITIIYTQAWNPVLLSHICAGSQ